MVSAKWIGARLKAPTRALFVLISAMVSLPADAGTTTYEYDSRGRLKKASNGSVVITYTYDAAGNRTSVQTQQPAANQAPTCTNSSTTVTGIPPGTGATATVDAPMVLARCSDPDGDALTIIAPTPALPTSATLFPGQSFTVNFAVSDGRGGSASGTISFTRPASTNQWPTCTNRTATITGVPSNVPANGSLTASSVLSQCSDPDGHTLTITSPSFPQGFSLWPGQSWSVNYTVSDGNGGTASATFTFVRP